MKVTVSGFYGFGNVGDEALLAGLLNGLQARGFEPVVLSRDPSATTKLHGVRARHRFGGVAAALLESGAFISGGGGLLQDRTSARSLDYYLWLLRTARALGKRVIVYGQSVGPLSPEGRRKVGKALDGLPVAVRDRSSRELLASLGVAAELVADTALLLEAPPPPPTRDRILLLPRSGHPELTGALVALARHLAAAGRQIEAVAFHPDEDERECRALAESVPGLPFRRVGDHREALRLFAGAGLVVSARLHGLILAAVSRTPAVGLVYDPKVAGFLAESGGSGFEPPVDEQALIEAARRAMPVASERLKELRSSAGNGLDWLARSLRGNPAAVR